MKLIQDTHVVTLLAPAADSLAGTVTTNYVNMQDYTHLTAYLSRGAVTSAGTSVVTVQSGTTSAGGTVTAIPFRVKLGTVSTLDAYADEADVTSAGYTTTASKANIIDIIEINASDMSGTNKYVAIKSVEAVGGPITAGIVGILSGARQQGDDLRTVRV